MVVRYGRGAGSARLRGQPPGAHGRLYKFLCALRAGLFRGDTADAAGQDQTGKARLNALGQRVFCDRPFAMIKILAEEDGRRRNSGDTR